MTYQVRKATQEDLDRLWDRSIAENPGDPSWIRWKKQFLDDNASGAAATFAVVCDGEPVGEGTLLFSPACRAIRQRLWLADGERVCNINALRIRPEHEGRGHISRLVAVMEEYARSQGYDRVTIGVEAAEPRNLAIYRHWGFDEFVGTEMDGDALVLYYARGL